MPELLYVPDPPKSAKDSRTDHSGLDHMEDIDTGPKPKRWKLRLRKKPETDEKDGKKKSKKNKRKKQETPPPEDEVEEWELGPTMEEMRQGVLDKYYEDVRTRAKLLLEFRKQTGARRLVVPPTAEYLRSLLDRELDEISSVTTILTESDISKLPTILEASREQFGDSQPQPKSGMTLHSILTQLATQGNAEDTAQKALPTAVTPSEAPSSPVKARSIIDSTNDALLSPGRERSNIQTPSEARSSPFKNPQEVQDILAKLESITKPVKDIPPVSAAKTNGTLSTSSDTTHNDNIDQNIAHDDGGESLNENEAIARPRPYDNNQFGRRITKESVLHHVQNKQSGFIHKKQTIEEEKDADDTFDEEDMEIEKKDEEEEEHAEEVLEDDELRAMFECVWEGDVDLLDDLLDLPGANINLTWFGENLLMTAIRAGKNDVAAYLIDNEIDTRAEAARFERRDDLRIEIEMQRAIEQTHEKGNKKKGKKKGKEKEKEKEKLIALEVSSNDVSTTRDTIRDDGIKSPDRMNSKLADMECYMIDCREMAQEFGMSAIVDLIDGANGQVWNDSDIEDREPRVRQTLEDKLRCQDLYIESDDEHFMVEPDKPKPLPEETPIDDKKLKKKRHSTADIHKKFSSTEPYLSHQPTPLHGATPQIQDTMQPIHEPDVTLVETPIPATPPPIVNVELPRSKTKHPFRGSRAFLTRRAVHLKGKDVQRDGDTPDINEPRKLVEVHGSFATESKAWAPRKALSKSNNPLISRSLGDFESIVLRGPMSEVERFSRLRQVKPWAEDNQEYFNNLLRRQNASVKVPSMREQGRPRLMRENTVLPIVSSSFSKKSSTSPLLGAMRYPPPNLSRSQDLSPLRTRAAQADEEQKQARKSANIRERLTKSSDFSYRVRQATFVHETKPRSTPLQPVRQPRLCQRSLAMDLTSHATSSKRQEKSHKFKDNAYPQRVITMQKYYNNTPSKRLSPAGLLKASHGISNNQVTDSIRTSLEKITGAPQVKKFTRFATVTATQA